MSKPVPAKISRPDLTSNDLHWSSKIISRYPTTEKFAEQMLVLLRSGMEALGKTKILGYCDHLVLEGKELYYLLLGTIDHDSYHPGYRACYPYDIKHA